MLRRRIRLLQQILLFVLVTLLGIATSYLINEAHSPSMLAVLERWALPLAGVTAAVMVSVIIWQHVADERASTPTAQ